MSLTRAAVEAEIVDRVGPRMSYVGMSTTTDGLNSSLNGPIRRALVAMGCVTASPLVVSDADLAAFAPGGSLTPAYDAWRLERLCDLATLQTLKSVLWKTTDVDWKAGQDQEWASQFTAQVESDVAALERIVSTPYGPDLPAASLGSMTAAPIPNDPFDPWRSHTRPGHIYP